MKIDWSTCAGGLSSAECRSNLLFIVHEKTCFDQFNLFKKTAKKCQKTLIIDEDDCQEGCSYALAFRDIANCFIAEQKKKDAAQVYDFGEKVLDSDLGFEAGGESSLIRDFIKEGRARLNKGSK